MDTNKVLNIKVQEEDIKPIQFTDELLAELGQRMNLSKDEVLESVKKLQELGVLEEAV